MAHNLTKFTFEPHVSNQFTEELLFWGSLFSRTTVFKGKNLMIAQVVTAPTHSTREGNVFSRVCPSAGADPGLVVEGRANPFRGGGVNPIYLYIF